MVETRSSRLAGPEPWERSQELEFHGCGLRRLATDAALVQLMFLLFLFVTFVCQLFKVNYEHFTLVYWISWPGNRSPMRRISLLALSMGVM